MPTNTSDQQITLPVDADTADNPVAFSNFVVDVEPKLVRAYTDTADRTTRMTSLAENAISTLGTEDRVEIYDGANQVSLQRRSLFAFSRKTATQALTPSSTTLQNITDLVVALPSGISGAVFFWTATIYYDASAVADFQFGFTMPAGATVTYHSISEAVADTGEVNFEAWTNGNGRNWRSSAVGSMQYGRVEGILVMGASAGSLQLQGAQVVSDATNINVFLNSWIQMWRVS